MSQLDLKEIFYYIRRGWSGKVEKAILNNDFDVDVKNEFGDTPLHIAASTGYTSVVKLLLEHEADVNAKNKIRETPLHCASSEGIIGNVELLLEHKADVNAINKDGDTPLHLACKESYLEAVKLLLKSGADINIKNYNDKLAYDVIEGVFDVHIRQIFDELKSETSITIRLNKLEKKMKRLLKYLNLSDSDTE